MGTRYIIFTLKHTQELFQNAFCSLEIGGCSDIQVRKIRCDKRQKKSGSFSYKSALFKLLFEGIIIFERTHNVFPRT